MADPVRTGEAGHVGVIVIHGNGEAQSGWINHSIVARLEQRLADTQQPGRVTFVDRSEVVELPEALSRQTAPAEPGSAAGPPPFRAFLRRGETSSGAKVTFAELNWADLSRVGAEPIYQAFAALRLFYDAPNVLTRSFLPGSASWYHIVLKRLILLAIWIVRWLVAGLNGVTFFAVLAITLVSVMLPPSAKVIREIFGVTLPTLMVGDRLLFVLVAVIAALVLLCGWLALLDEKDNFGLTDVWVATACMGVAAIGAITAMGLLYPDHERWDVISYVKPAIELNFLLGMAWDAVATAAILLWLLLCAKRAIIAGPVGTPALWSVSAALALCIVQAQVWKICVPAAGALTINALGWSDRLETEFARLNGVGVLNSALTAIDIGLALLLLRTGAWVRRWPGDLDEAAVRAPRVIVSWLLVAALAAGTFANLYLHYTVEFGGTTGTQVFAPFCGRDNISVCVANSPWLKLLIATFGLALLWLLAFGRLQAVFLAVLHFGRDIVDHQYRSDHNAALSRVRGRALLAGNPYPRRERVRRRLDALASRILSQERFDRLVFLTHSQGSVIAYDCFVSGSPQTRALLSGASELHVVTLGSPISHLYQYYFLDYVITAHDTRWVPDNLASWTNMWRIDDPIARHVTVGDPNIVSNVPLEPGGHDDYWREAAVCDHIIALLDAPLAPAPGPTQLRPGLDAELTAL